MGLFLVGRELCPPTSEASSQKSWYTFSPAWICSATGLPLESSSPPAPSLSANAASSVPGRVASSHLTLLKMSGVSSPQVSASVMPRRGLKPSWR